MQSEVFVGLYLTNIREVLPAFFADARQDARREILVAFNCGALRFYALAPGSLSFSAAWHMV